MSGSAHPSRQSKTNRADPANDAHGPSNHRSLSRPLTQTEGISLREEALDRTADEGEINVVSWREAIREWRDYIRDSRETASVFENSEGETVKASDPNRFMEDYGNRQYAKLKDLERGVRDDYGKRLHTAMLTLTASSTNEDGEPIPPVDHLEELLSSWSAVRRALARSLDGRRYERLAILEPHESGYLHVHMAVFVDGVVTSGTFEQVIEAHVQNCDLAGWSAHDVEDDDTISVRHAGSDRERWRANHAMAEGTDHERDGIGNLASYLSEYLGTFGGDPLEAEENQQMANAVLWLTGRQRWRPSNGAQEYMKTEESEDESDWEFLGIEDADGEIHEVESGGGVTRIDSARVTSSGLDDIIPLTNPPPR